MPLIGRCSGIFIRCAMRTGCRARHSDCLGKGAQSLNVIAINGSPRKNWHTATLLERALEGAGAMGAQTELIHLYDLDYKGCMTCFTCKSRKDKGLGKCAVMDGLTPVLERIGNASAFVLGSPIFFGSVTGEMRSFMERLLFPYLAYTSPPNPVSHRKIPTAFIYTINKSDPFGEDANYPVHFGMNEKILGRIFSQSEMLYCRESLQSEDYDSAVNSLEPLENKERRKMGFLADCQKAYEMGTRLVQ